MLGWRQESEHLLVDHRTGACDCHDAAVVFVDVPSPAFSVL
jgi:hypothetical protein